MWDKVLTWTTETYLAMAIGTLHAVKCLVGTDSLVLKISTPLFITYLTCWPAIIFLILYRNRR
jgi:hypothetical protein